MKIKNILLKIPYFLRLRQIRSVLTAYHFNIKLQGGQFS